MDCLIKTKDKNIGVKMNNLLKQNLSFKETFTVFGLLTAKIYILFAPYLF